MSAMPSLTLSHVNVTFDARPVLTDVSLNLNGGGLVGLIGPNGAGKTTLLRVCAGLIDPLAGAVQLDGRTLADWPRASRARRLGYLAQERTALWPVAAARLVALGRLPHLGPWDSLSDADEAAVLAAMQATDVTHLTDRPVTALSGGELTRVLVARLLAGAPDVVLADEPVSGLDPAHAMQVLDILRTRAGAGATVIVVLHDLTWAARYCDRLVLMDQGRIVADGAPTAVLTPEHLSRYYGIGVDVLNHGGAMVVVPRPLS